MPAHVDEIGKHQHHKDTTAAHLPDEWPSCAHAFHVECLVRYIRGHRSVRQHLNSSSVLPSDEVMASIECPHRAEVLVGIGVEAYTQRWGVAVPVSSAARCLERLHNSVRLASITAESLNTADAVAAVEADIVLAVSAQTTHEQHTPMPQLVGTMVVCCVRADVPANDPLRFCNADWLSSCPAVADGHGGFEAGPACNDWACNRCGNTRAATELPSPPALFRVDWPLCPSCQRDLMWVSTMDNTNWQGVHCIFRGREKFVQ